LSHRLVRPSGPSAEVSLLLTPTLHCPFELQDVVVLVSVLLAEGQKLAHELLLGVVLLAEDVLELDNLLFIEGQDGLVAFLKQ
jgi:hypothetical protein